MKPYVASCSQYDTIRGRLMPAAIVLLFEVT